MLSWLRKIFGFGPKWIEPVIPDPGPGPVGVGIKLKALASETRPQESSTAARSDDGKASAVSREKN